MTNQTPSLGDQTIIGSSSAPRCINHRLFVDPKIHRNITRTLELSIVGPQLDHDWTIVGSLSAPRCIKHRLCVLKCIKHRHCVGPKLHTERSLGHLNLRNMFHHIRMYISASFTFRLRIQICKMVRSRVSGTPLALRRCTSCWFALLSYFTQGVAQRTFASHYGA